MKRDHDAKQTVLKQSLKPILDKMMELSQDLDTLKTEIKTMKGLKLAPGVAPFKTAKNVSNNSVTYVRVALTQNRGEVHEFPTDENGNLSFTLQAGEYESLDVSKSSETRS